MLKWMCGKTNNDKLLNGYIIGCVTSCDFIGTSENRNS